MKKITSLTAAVVLAAGMSGVNAEEAMQLSAAQMEGVTAGGVDFLKVRKDIKATAFIVGNIAHADAFADAFCGKTKCDTFTQTSAQAFTVNYQSSTSYSNAISATY